MGFWDVFKRKNNKFVLPGENQSNENPYNYSDVVSNEIIEEIKKINNLEYISDIMIKRIEKHPKLVNLLLKGNISEDILFLLNHYEKMIYLPQKEDDLQFIEFVDLDERIQQSVKLLDNRVNSELINDEYISCYIDLSKEIETIDYHNEIPTFLPNVKIDLGGELLTKTSVWSPITLYLPKSKHKVISHNYEQFISGNIELDENAIVQMSYDTFRYLDESLINKISKCKIIFSEKDLDIDKNIDYKDKTDYKLVKYNHLIYIIGNSSLKEEIKEKLIYQIKNMYIDDTFYFDLELSNKITPYLNNLSFDEIEKLTKEFELNIEIYKTKNIERPKFNASFYIDEFIPNFEKASINEVINIINYLSDELKYFILKEPRVSKKLNIPDNLEEKEMKKLIFLLSSRLSTTTMDFIKSLNFDVETFIYDPNNNYYSSSDINPIISDYGVFDYGNEEVVISVADLIGHDGIVNCGGYKGKNILYTFENFYEKYGDDYHTRALELLNYKSGEELINGLERRNRDTIDMKVGHLEEGKYIISSNGLHRFTVLRFHYLLDLMKKEKSVEELRELYKIPVTLVKTTNFKKTYCNYLIHKANPDISSIWYDTKNDEITIYHKSEKQAQIINEEKLLYLTIQSVDALDSITLLEIMNFYNKYDSFHKFIDKYIPNLLEKIETKNEEVVQK